MILRKIIKIIATRCRILRLKCTEFDLGWGSAPDPAGELTAFPQTLAGFKGKGEGKGIGKGRGEGWGGWGTGGEEGMETKEGMDFGKTKNDSDGATRFSFFLNLATGLRRKTV